MYQAVIIDDESLIIEGLLNIIDWGGYNIEIAYSTTDPQEAVQYILNNSVQLVITDISMPVMDGLTLTKKIKDAKPSIYVLILSAYNNFNYVRSALRLGAENYLLKPVDKDELSDSIEQILGNLETREQIQGSYGSNAMTFRNAFNEQWLKNMLTGDSLATHAELLGVNLNSSSFTVVIFSSREHSEKTMSQFLDFFLHHILGHFTANFYFETPYRLACILSPTTTPEESVSGFLVPILQLAQNGGLDIFASIGPTVSSHAGVPASYNRSTIVSILEYSNFSICDVDAFSLPDTSVVSLADALNFNETDITLFVKKTLTKYSHTQVLYGLVLSWLKEYLQNNILELPEKYPGFIELLHTIPQALSNDDVLNTIQEFLNITRKYMETSSESISPMVEAVIKSINSFSDKDISLKTLAAKLNVSPSYLGTVFRQQTGYYFNEYLTEARLKLAASLLETTDLKIKDIVEKCCFASQTYFNRSFKRHFTISPADYRRQKKIQTINS